MTDQQWTVVADRDKGDDPTIDDITVGDRYTMQAEAGAVFTDQVVRIERQVPTAEKPNTSASNLAIVDLGEASRCADVGLDALIDYLGDLPRLPSPHPPTREQIAEALYLDDADHEDLSWASEANLLTREAYLKNADAVLALIQNGADR
jgi:hypothetical protein